MVSRRRDRQNGFELKTGWGNDGSKLKILIIYLLLYGIAVVSYKKYLIVYWKYYGFKWSFDLVSFFESLVLLLVIVLFLPARPKKPSDFLVHLHMVVPVLPMLVLYGVSIQSRAYIYMAVLAFIFVLRFKNVFFPVRIPFNGFINPLVLMKACLIIGYITIILILAQGGYKYLNFNLLNVYEFRRSAAANLPEIFSYVSPAVSKVIFPFSLVISLFNRRYFYSVASALGSVLMFGLTSHKGPLFYPMLVVLLYIFTMQRQIIISFLSVFLTVFTITTIYAVFYGNTFLPSLIIRRLFFIPAGANFGYHNYFTDHPHTYLGSSKITFGLVDYPYDVPPPVLIGKEYWGADVSANTGWIGTAYMHFDYFGLILFALVVGFLLATIDSISKRQNKSLVTAIVTVPCFSLFVSTDLPTALLTHGILISFFLCMVMSKTHWNVSLRKP